MKTYYIYGLRGMNDFSVIVRSPIAVLSVSDCKVDAEKLFHLLTNGVPEATFDHLYQLMKAYHPTEGK